MRPPFKLASMRWAAVAIITLALGSQQLSGQADPGAEPECDEKGPHGDPWECVQNGTAVPGTLSQTLFRICVGGSGGPPTETGTRFTDGSKRRWEWYDCPENDIFEGYELGTVPYTKGPLYFEPPWPASFPTAGRFRFRAKVDGTPAPLNGTAGAGDCGCVTADLGEVVVESMRILVENISTATYGKFMRNSYKGQGQLDPLADRYRAAINQLNGALTTLQQAKTRDSETGIESVPAADVDAYRTKVNDFKTECDAIRDALAALPPFEVVPTVSEPLQGTARFMVRNECADCSPISVTITPRVKSWASTTSFGTTLWSSVTPTSFSVGSQLVQIDFNGNYGTIEVTVHEGDPCNRDTVFDIIVPKFICEEDLVHEIMHAFNANKSRINGKLSGLDLSKSFVTVVKAGTELLHNVTHDPILGTLGPIIEGAGEIVYALLKQAYETEADTNLQQVREHLRKLELMPECSPLGAPEDLDLNLYGDALSAH